MLRFAPLLILGWFISTIAANAQPAGSLIAAEPVQVTPAGMQAWSVRYLTTDGQGRSREVTGMVVAPREAIPSKPRRVIAWAHGTWGVAEKCAPSLSPNFFDATPALADLIRDGYVVVAPDYVGLGNPGPHPYLVGVDTGRAVLDAVRAAREISGAASGADFAVWGESQGGHAALWTAALAKSYAPDLHLVATAAAAPPTDLPANLRQGTDANVRAMLTAFVAYSWSQHYGFSLATLFNRTNQGVARRLAQNNCISLGAKPKLGTILGVSAIRGALKNKDIGTIAPWSGAAKRNSVTPRAVPGPLLIAQSVEDPVVAPGVTRTFARGWCKLARPLRYVSIPGGDHGHSARDSASATLTWLADQFAGKPTANDCRKI